ncbi:MAG: response regulator [Calditrichaceae bacterium]
MAKRLLIVDDEETLTFSLYQSFILSDKDYEVITANSGDEALTKINENPFDLIITDILMPGMSGIDLLKRVKQDFPKTEIVIMTAYGSNDRRDEVLKLGARFYIEKPFEMKEFKKIVLEILG